MLRILYLFLKFCLALNSYKLLNKDYQIDVVLSIRKPVIFPFSSSLVYNLSFPESHRPTLPKGKGLPRYNMD